MRKGIFVIGISLILIAFFVIGPISGALPSFFPNSVWFMLYNCGLIHNDSDLAIPTGECPFGRGMGMGMGITTITSDILSITGLILVIKGVLTSPKGKKNDLPSHSKGMFIGGICMIVFSHEVSTLHMPYIFGTILLPTGLILTIMGITKVPSRFRTSTKTELK